MLGALPEAFAIFQWHDDTFSLPENAVRLAGNDIAENQAFRIGRAVYGFQFHFEADRRTGARLEHVLCRDHRDAHSGLGRTAWR